MLNLESIIIETAISKKTESNPGNDVNIEFKSSEVEILKIDQEKQLVYGVVLEPDMVDAHEDIMTSEEIEKAAHFYLTNSRIVGSNHSKGIKANVVESYISPSDFVMNEQNVKKGSWILVVKVNDDTEWSKIKKGTYNSFSVGGYGKRKR